MAGFHQRMRAGSKTAPGWIGFSGQHTNPVRAQRRRNIAIAGGIRQFKRIERLSKGLA